ncbi:MAG: crotonase [Myxococcales bacterium]|nr:crotonase [Myxococcales bacterium]
MTPLPVGSTASAPLPESDDLVLLEREGAVARLTINRPKSLNALNRQVLACLSTRLDLVANDAGVRAVVLTGAGDRAFVAGADIVELQPMDYFAALAFSQAGNAVMAKIEQMRKPVIAAVNGFALGGGCELALVCDVILASKSARFGLPEVSLGVIPGFGGTQRLARLIGRNAAKHWVMTGDVYTADEAMRIGLVYQVHEPADLLGAAMTVARKMAARGPVAVAEAKHIINGGLQLPLSAAIELESAAFARCFLTADQKEGMAAFVEKRTAQFAGN